MKLANITLGVCGNFARTIPVDNGLSLDFRSVMGVEIPKISLESSKLMPYFGFNSTNSHLDEAYINFNEAKKMTVKLAETGLRFTGLRMRLRKRKSVPTR